MCLDGDVISDSLSRRLVSEGSLWHLGVFLGQNSG